MRRTLGAVAALALAGSAQAGPSYTILEYEDLAGWAEDDHAAALDVFRNTCMDFRVLDWDTLCALASDTPDARAFFELFFTPVLIEDDEEMLFTGYFEPELRGSRYRSARFRYPLYEMPPEVGEDPWLSRREIEETGVLADRGLEIVWVDDPVELFFLQLQGSGRIRLTNGDVVRVGYGGANKRPYTSIGMELVARGVFEQHEVSAQVIRDYVRENPAMGRELLWANESYVFFREVSHVPGHLGPLGAMNRSITPLRTIAVDPSIYPLGAPVWIEKQGEEPMNRLMVAQDTGSAIKGAQRADVFFGAGSEAGRRAGQVRDGGRMVVLLPIQRAYAMLPETVE
ncbi:MltA/3D domain protein [Oceanicola granulosus HTCC2516]|uniref:peptidoglycan lytic exotransglycosylase n=1 Tax=Oceanicola granulosus (strain ATCC BAA-861 / DSM 15982 / KCTC 12143 / HTCC2516) TaxID=314256 RepID=Q2CJV2_OCEGH|nr:MltA domain-containing protein [Oceanicola granulosus]EAR53037.1 MltA/3D domain protein [Oceanicola granulosus HTCC2516]